MAIQPPAQIHITTAGEPQPSPSAVVAPRNM